MLLFSKKGLKKYFTSVKRKPLPSLVLAKIGRAIYVFFKKCFAFLVILAKCFLGLLLGLYRLVLKVPVIGFIVSFPERFCRSMFLKDRFPPLFMKPDDAMAFSVKLGKDSARHKILSSFVVIGLMLVIVGRFSLSPSLLMMKPFVARLKLHGAIGMSSFGIEDRLPKVIDQLIKEKKVLAVIVSIDSPGGTVAASELLYKNLLRLAVKKPTIASVKTYAASGGYLMSLGCGKIFALETSEIGSIGVFRKVTNVIELEKKLGLKTKLYKSSPFKAAPNMYEEITPEVDRNEIAGIKATLDWFAGIVKERRGFSRAQLEAVANAKTFPGIEAVKLGLIDEIGDEFAIMERLVKEGVIDESAKMLDINYMPSQSSSHKIVARMINKLIGVDIVNEFENSSNAGPLMLQY